MGHAEEDKDLMMVRMETLQTMIGRLKKKTNRAAMKESTQSASSTDEEPVKEGSQPATPVRATTLTPPRSPSSSAISDNNKRRTTPSSLSLSKKLNPNRTSPLAKIRTKQNSTSPLTLSQGGSTAPSEATISLNSSPLKLPPTTSSLPLSATSLRILKVNSLLPKAKTNIQTASNAVESKVHAAKIKVPLHSSVSNETMKGNKLKPVASICKPTNQTKSYSDSEIPLRKNVTKNNTCSDTGLPTCTSAISSRSSSFFSLNTRSASTEPIEVSLIGNRARSLPLSPASHIQDPIVTVRTGEQLTEQNSVSIDPTCAATVANVKYINKPVSRPPSHTITKPDKQGCNTAVSSVGSNLPTDVKKSNKSIEKPILPKTGKVLFERTGKVLFDRHAHTTSPNKMKFLAPGSPNQKPLSRSKTTANFAHEFQLIRERHASSHTSTTRTKFFSTEYVPPEMSKKARVILSKYKVVRNKDKNIPTVPNTNNSSPSTSLSPSTSNAVSGKILYDKDKNILNVPDANNTSPSSSSSSSMSNAVGISGKILYQKEKNILTVPKTNNSSPLSSSPSSMPNAFGISGKILYHKDKNILTVPDSNNSSPSSSSSSTSNAVGISGKILYQRQNMAHARGYPSVFSLKGRGYPITKVNRKPCKTFVSRRMKYIKRSPNVKGKKEIIISRYGTNYKVSGNLKSLRRLSADKVQKAKAFTKPATVPGKNLLANPTSKLSSKSVSVKQYAASQVLRKTMTVHKKVNKEKYCLFYNRFGKCKRGDQCKFIHDADKIAICTRFLRGTCKDENCLFSHKLDPDKMPVCSYFLRGECSRDNCPYRHVKVAQSASVCDDFLKGYCARGKECTKKHILECEEFITTGVCSKGTSCLLNHRQGTIPKRKNSGSRPLKGLHQKRKKIEETDEGKMNGEYNNESGNSHQNKTKKHKLPKFVSKKIKLLREGLSEKPASFAGIKKVIESTTPTEKSPEGSTKSSSLQDDFWNCDFIPLSNYSGGESDDEDGEFIQRMFTFKSTHNR